MIENDKHTQDWSQENKDALLAFIESVMTLCDHDDICAVGSRVYWHDYADSDIDIVVFVPDDSERIPPTFSEYEGVKVAMTYQPISLRDGLAHGKFKMPQYSLITGTLYEGIEEDWIACRAMFRKSL